MLQGWIKVHRKLLNNPICGKAKYLQLWILLLLLAQHEETSFIWNNERIVIKEGQFLTSRRQLSMKTKISESYVEKILKYLEKEHQITQQKTTKFRIITIKNWDRYQQKDSSAPTERTTKRQQRGQQKDTYKNNKNNKNEKNEKKGNARSQIFVPPSVKEVEEYAHTINYPISGIKFVSHYQQKGWMVGRKRGGIWIIWKHRHSWPTR